MTRARRLPSQRAHELVHVIHRCCLIEGMGLPELSSLSGVSETAMNNWWRGGNPGLAQIEAALGVFGLRAKAGAAKADGALVRRATRPSGARNRVPKPRPGPT